MRTARPRIKRSRPSWASGKLNYKEITSDQPSLQMPAMRPSFSTPRQQQTRQKINDITLTRQLNTALDPNAGNTNFQKGFVQALKQMGYQSMNSLDRVALVAMMRSQAKQLLRQQQMPQTASSNQLNPTIQMNLDLNNPSTLANQLMHNQAAAIESGIQMQMSEEALLNVQTAMLVASEEETYESNLHDEIENEEAIEATEAENTITPHPGSSESKKENKKTEKELHHEDKEILKIAEKLSGHEHHGVSSKAEHKLLKEVAEKVFEHGAEAGASVRLTPSAG